MLNDIPNEFLQVFGSIGVDFIFLERELMITISDSIGIDEYSILRLISTDSFDTLLSKSKNLLIYKLHDKGIKDEVIFMEIDTLFDKLNKINERRNKIMHSLWFPDGNGNLKRHKFKKRINKSPSIDDKEIITMEDLNNFLNEIDINFQLLSSYKDKLIKLLSNKLVRINENNQNETENQKET